MWKYVTRRLRDTFERNVNHFDRRSTTIVNSSSPNEQNEEKKVKYSSPCKWFSSRKCWSSYQNDNDTNSRKWSFDYLNKSWIGAITWSSALVLGWYTSQLIHLKLKYQLKENKKTEDNRISSTILPFLICRNQKNEFHIDSVSTIEKLVSNFTPTLQLITNDHNRSKERTSLGGSASPDTSDDALGEVLNSIENRLGLAAIQNGQYQDGLNLLRSAANRNHAPAIYNLGICYEMGLGVTINEQMAMELYRSAAALDHPGALYNLGIYYGQGRGGLKINLDTATRLLRLAAVQGQQDAVDALKALDLEIMEPRNHLDTWNYEGAACHQNESIVPTHTRLFVENINFLQNQKCDATVY